MKKFLLWCMTAIFITVVIGCGGLNSNRSASERKKSENLTISDEEIKTLLNNGYVIQRKLENHYLSILKEIKISNNYYKKLPNKFKNKENVYKYCGEEFGLNKYYSNNYIKSLVDFVVKDINGEYYAIVGQSGEYLNIKDATITSKKYEGNKIYITYDASAEDDPKVSHYKSTLVYEDGKWLIHESNFLIY